ncbi:MAG: hypothetical protein HC917_26395 [Richelia sp. SM2_1_7]|nr:hypothetical protein [Richelia sp. SM2_1_7]
MSASPIAILIMLAMRLIRRLRHRAALFRYFSHPIPLPSPSKRCGSGGRTLKLRSLTFEHCKSGEPLGMHKSG